MTPKPNTQHLINRWHMIDILPLSQLALHRTGIVSTTWTFFGLPMMKGTTKQPTNIQIKTICLFKTNKITEMLLKYCMNAMLAEVFLETEDPTVH